MLEYKKDRCKEVLSGVLELNDSPQSVFNNLAYLHKSAYSVIR